jgi:hypothetical protein
VNGATILNAAAAVCFAVATLIATSVVHGTSYSAWLAGGLLAWALAKFA